jgi:outer membrane protein assembly factor BamD
MPFAGPFRTLRSAAFAAFTVSAVLLATGARAQETTPAPAPPPASQDSAATPPPAQADATMAATPTKGKKKPKVDKADKVVQSKDTRREIKKENKLNPLVGKDANLPDKALYDKAVEQTRKGHYDVARLDLQTLLNTYPDSQYQMRAKLAIGDSWYREGGSAALTQAEQEYNDFITFFPNVPEAAEAQMRVGDIYLKQMDVPDRDYTKALKAEEAYRLMLKQYPDSALVGDARQKLREVQEILALREAGIAAFYATHDNWPATIARFQTVADTYPLYSHMDDVLIAIGDAYAAESRVVRAQPLPEAAKAKLLQTYDNQAAAYYRKVVLEHSAAPHVEDAKERLVSMGLPVPKPTAEQEAASEKLEGSRAQYTLSKKLAVLLLRKPDTVTTARTGEPPLDDPAATVAPTINNQLIADYKAAFGVTPDAAKPVTDAVPADTPAPAAVPVSNAPLALQDVAGPGEGATGGGVSSMTAATPSSAAPAGNSVGVEVLTPGVNTTPDPNTGLSAVGPKNTAALPPVEKPADSPDQVNEVAGKAQPAAQTKDPNSKKNPNPPLDKQDESSSKHKPKKGLDKINPF